MNKLYSIVSKTVYENFNITRTEIEYNFDIHGDYMAYDTKFPSFEIWNKIQEVKSLNDSGIYNWMIPK